MNKPLTEIIIATNEDRAHFFFSSKTRSNWHQIKQRWGSRPWEQWRGFGGPLELLFSASASAALELLQTLNALLHGALSVDLVVSGAHIHRVARLLLLSHHFDRKRAERKSIFLKERKRRGGGDKEESESCCHWPRMKLYCANCAFLIFLFRVQPGSRSTSVMKPLLWKSCLTCRSRGGRQAGYRQFAGKYTTWIVVMMNGSNFFIDKSYNKWSTLGNLPGLLPSGRTPRRWVPQVRSWLETVRARVAWNKTHGL